jgi:putative MFS transporter
MTYLEFLDNSPMTGFLWLLLFGLCLAQLLDGFDFLSTSFAMPGMIREFHLNPPQAGLIASVTNIGLMLGAIFFPMFCDGVGRKPVFQMVLLTYAVGTFLSAVAPSYNVLLVARFVAGVGIGAQLPIVMAILAEFSPARLRHIFVPVGPIFYSFGWIIAALLSIWLIPWLGWRSIYWVGIIPAFLSLFVRYFLPESVRFLLAHGKVEEAGRITADLARRAKMEHLELVPPPQSQGATQMTFREQFGLLGAYWGRTLMLAFFFFCSFVQTFGLNAWLPTIFIRQGFRLTTSFSYTLMIFSVTPLSHVIAMWLQNRIDRKWALFIMTFGGTVFFVLFGLSFQYHWPIWVLVGSQVMQTLLAQGVVAILFTLSAELYPTPVRTLGMGLVNGVGRLGAVLGPFLLGVFLHFGTQISDIIYFYAAPLLVAAIVALFAIKVDPRRRSLDQIGAAAGAGKAS